MALVLRAYPTDLSTQADFTAHKVLIEAGYFDQVNAPLLVRDGVIPQGVVLQVGSTVYEGTSDTAISTASSAPSDYVEVTPDGATATAKYVATLTGVTWNAQYNGYYDSGGTKLYLFDEGKALNDAPQVTALLSRYVTRNEVGDTYIGRDLAVKRNETVGGTLGVTGALSAASVNTGQGAHQLGQNVRTTDNVTFNTVNARTFDTFGGFHQGGGVNDTNLPVGAVITVARAGQVTPSRNEARTVYLATAANQYTLAAESTQLVGTWRARGLSGSGYNLFQRTAT